MNFGLDKCKTIKIKKGKILSGSYVVNEIEEIKAMEIGDVYKYLGIEQSNMIDHKTLKEKVLKKFYSRLNLLCKQQLTGRNIIRAINTFAIPLLTYSFGIIKWSNTDIKNIEIKTRGIMTK